MDYKTKVEEILKSNMTEKGFNLWKGIDRILPNIWGKSTSSTGKYHKKANGEIPSQAEHVYHMLYVIVKIFKMFDIQKNTVDADKILIAIALHDSLKYGMMGNRKHTESMHDRNIANIISQNKDTFLKLFSEQQFYEIEEMTRFHSGRWSTDNPKDKHFDFKNYNSLTLMIHMLDMLSTADCLMTDIRE